MRRLSLRLVLRIAILSLCVAGTASAALIGTFVHDYGFGADPTAVRITLRVYDGQPGGRYLWEYTVENDTYDPVPGTSNGFSGFELALPSPIPEIADATPNPASTPPWEHNCCSGLPMEWDIRNSDGLGVMPGDSLIFSFTTNPRSVAINDAGWFHSWQFDSQTDIVTTPGMHVPWVLGLDPIPEPGTWGLAGLGLSMILLRRYKGKQRA